MQTQQGSYPFDNFVNYSEESIRLKTRSYMRLDGFLDLLKSHGLKNGDSILEIGCGHGIRSQMMAINHDQSKVTGLDISELLLDEARKSNSLPNLYFKPGSIYELPFEDETFDFVYLRLVFMHLNEPQKALSEIQRVLKPGGICLIEDADRNCMHFHPKPAEFNKFWQEIQEGQRNMGGDPNVGSKLESYFMNSGFKGVHAQLQSIHGANQEVKDLFVQLMPALNEYLPSERRGRGERVINEMLELVQKERVNLYHLWFTISARKEV